MSQLPSSLCNALLHLSARPPKASELAGSVATILEVELLCADLCRGLEAFREAAKVLGLLEESRDGKRVYEAWSKLSRFFVEPFGRLEKSFLELNAHQEPAPSGFESLGHRWERADPELVAFLEEQAALDSSLQESPVSTHVSFRIRSRVLLLDRRAERAKVALELIRRDLTAAARQGAAVLGGRAAGSSSATTPATSPSPSSGKGQGGQS